MLLVQTPALDRSLLTIEELRSAAGVSGVGEDEALQALGLRASDLIARACGVAAAGSAIPTLRRETLVETVTRPRSRDLRLSRRFISEVVSVVGDTVLILPGFFEIDGAAGIIERLHGRWWSDRVLVTYKAGFAEVPADLKHAAITAVREIHSGERRDPLLRAETVDGVGRQEFQIGGAGRDAGSALSAAVLDALAPYVTVNVA